MHLRHRQSAGQRQKAAAGLRLKAVQYLSMGEPELARLIFRLEADPLFASLRPFLRRGPAPGGSFYPLCETDGRGTELPADIGWEAHEREIALIRRAGQRAFEKYFLHGDLAFSEEETASATGLTPAEVRRVKAFVFAVSLQERPAAARAPASAARPSCLAKVVMAGGVPRLLWLLPQYARGRYEVDRPGLEKFMSSLAAAERGPLRRLLGAVELINMRQGTVRRLVELAVRSQRGFLSGGGELSLAPFTPSAAARKLAVHPSTVGRALHGRSLALEDGREFPLEAFFPNRRSLAVLAVRGLLEERPHATDEELRRALESRFGLRLSRRTVNECRHAAAGAGA